MQKKEEEIIKASDENCNYFKFSPAEQASKWKQFYTKNIIAVNYQSLEVGDISAYSSLEELTNSIDESLRKKL